MHYPYTFLLSSRAHCGFEVANDGFIYLFFGHHRRRRRHRTMDVPVVLGYLTVLVTMTTYTDPTHSTSSPSP